MKLPGWSYREKASEIFRELAGDRAGHGDVMNQHDELYRPRHPAQELSPINALSEVMACSYRWISLSKPKPPTHISL